MYYNHHHQQPHSKLIHPKQNTSTQNLLKSTSNRKQASNQQHPKHHQVHPNKHLLSLVNSKHNTPTKNIKPSLDPNYKTKKQSLQSTNNYLSNLISSTKLSNIFNSDQFYQMFQTSLYTIDMLISNQKQFTNTLALLKQVLNQMCNQVIYWKNKFNDARNQLKLLKKQIKSTKNNNIKHINNDSKLQKTQIKIGNHKNQLYNTDKQEINRLNRINSIQKNVIQQLKHQLDFYRNRQTLLFGAFQGFKANKINSEEEQSQEQHNNDDITKKPNNLLQEKYQTIEKIKYEHIYD